MFLILSYNTGYNRSFNYVDLIRYEILTRALESAGSEMHTSFHPASMHYLKSDFTCTRPSSEPIVELHYGKSDDTDDTEVGRLRIVWEDLEKFLLAAPCSVTWIPKYGEPEDVKFKLIEYYDDSRPRHIIHRELGGDVPHTVVLHKKEFDTTAKRFPAATLEYIKVFLAKKIHQEIKEGVPFSVGGMFPKESEHWQKELKPLWEVLKDELLASYFLSGLVQTVLLNSPHTWAAMKSRMHGRGFDTLHFWIHEK